MNGAEDKLAELVDAVDKARAAVHQAGAEARAAVSQVRDELVERFHRLETDNAETRGASGVIRDLIRELAPTLEKIGRNEARLDRHDDKLSMHDRVMWALLVAVLGGVIKLLFFMPTP